MRRLVAIAVAACATFAEACLDTQPCVERGTTRTFGGSASYVGQVAGEGGSMASLVGSAPATVEVDDFSNANACSGNTVEFTVRTASCVLWATSDDADGGIATIEDGQTCGVPIAQGVATLQLDQGLLSAGSDPVTLALSGSIVAVGDAGVEGGYLQWTFSSE